MIALASDCLIFQTPSGESVPYSADMVCGELSGGSVELFDPEFVRHAASAVFHYFKHELRRQSVSLSEFTGALEKVLGGFAITAPPPNQPESQPDMLESDLFRLACESGEGCELFFFPRLRAELRQQLQQAGFNVVLTRDHDIYPTRAERPDIANRRGADLFVSLHFNATEIGRDEVSGPETYCITPVGASSSNAQGEGRDHGPTTANRNEQKSLLFAYQIEKSLVQNLGVNDRGVRRARFAVLRDAAMPAVLIECGYMTHPVEGKKILDSTYRRQMAQAIVTGILAYQKLTVPPIPSTLPAANRLAVRIPPSSWTGTDKISPKSQTR